MIGEPVRRGLVFGLGSLFLYLVFCEFFFVTHATSGIFRPLTSLVVIPAATARGETVSYRRVAELTHGVLGFGGTMSKKEAFDRALAVSVYRLYLEDLAKELEIKVTREEIEAYALEHEMIAPGLEIARWDEKDYRKFIIKPLLLAQKTEAAISVDAAYQALALETMASFRNKVAQGMPFADVAQNFSQDPSALSRGDMGIMSLKNQADWLKPALALVDKEVGTVSEILHAPDAYWTVTLIEFFPSEIYEQAAIHFRGIAVKKKTMGSVIDQMMSHDAPWVSVW